MAKSLTKSLASLQTSSITAYSLRTASADDEIALAAEEEITWTLDTSGNYKSTDNFADGKRYEDSDISYIDEKKIVTINQNQINLTQEDNSQYIPFEMFRYYDGIDLMNMKLSVFFMNEDGDYGESTPINVRYSDTKIRFGFLVPKEATAIKGTLKLEIQARGASPLGGNYVLKTQPNSEIKILESLQGNGSIIVDENWATSVLEDVQQAAIDAEAASAIAKEYAEQASAFNTQTTDTVNNALTEMQTAINNASTTISAEVKAEMADTYYTQDQTNNLIDERLGTLQDDEENDLSVEEYVAQEIEKADISDKLTEYATKQEVAETIGDTGSAKTVVEYVDDMVASVDVSDQFGDLGTNEDGTTKTVVQYVTEAVESVDISDKLGNLVNGEGNELTVEEYVKQEVEAIDVSEQLGNYYTKDESDDNFASKSIESSVETNTANIQTANTAITSINTILDSIDKSPNAYYETTYNEPYTLEGTEYTGENTLVLWEIYNKGTENETRTVASAHVITGGSGGSSSANTIVIERITNTPLVVTSNDEVIIEYNFTGTDSSGEDIGQGKATWKIGSITVKTESIYTGVNSVDLTDYISVGSDQKITLIITDDIGTVSQKTWYVSVVDVKLESTFDDTRAYTADSSVIFTYTPYGAVDKIVHFLMDGEEIDTITSLKAAAGLSASYTIPAQSHGTHLFEVYMTATINNNDIESNHIIKDIIWYDENSDIPVISCVQQEFTAKQYEATNIVYTVYDPSTETPNVNLKATYVNEDGETVEEYNSNLVLSNNTDTWQYKTAVIGEHILTITCGETVKTLVATIEDIGIEVSPTTAGLEFDFNPVGYSNNDENRIWVDSDTGVTMTLSDNFDWTNGGYQIDDDGDQYFCVKAGTTATVNYNLFADDAKTNGKEFKVIFKTTNVKNRDTSFISCMDEGIGLDMRVEDANVYSSNGSLYSPYCEDDIIEFEFNISASTDIPMVMTYEDGVGNRPMIYTSDSSFWQATPQPIIIGSENCDVHVYRMKAYSTSLSDKDILNNFIADARNAEEMIDRYNRNQIYKEGVLDAEYLAKVCPDLRIILLDAPWFTNDKDNKVKDTTITMIYKNGDPVLDNWTCTGATHRGQGTSSNEYGYASRNIDLVMNTDTSLFTLGDGVTTASTITLTRDSVPTNYLNCKVNVASSEMENNAQNAKDYSLFNPFIRFARWKDSKVKDCMEFYNAVIFIRENNEDISTHREFQDTNYHFYSLANVGDSKKTDDTRVNDKTDPKEYVVEIMDYNVPLAEFPTGVDGICPEDEWVEGNTAYDLLYSEYEYEDGEFKGFGSGSYEFRYEMKGITDEQRQINIDTWREMYKFVVTSSNEDFYSKLKEWFVVDSVLYYYLFTENRTMVDNRAKNLFIHYGKVYISDEEAVTLGTDAGGYILDNEQAAIREGYRYDIAFGYDFDTALGIGNTGKLNIPYGKEDVDFYVDGDSTSGYIYRAAESTFFCKVRDLFKSEMQAMYVELESENLWSSTRMINQWDEAQNQFPEELYRLHYQRLYLRTYQGVSVDNSLPGEANPRFLEEMMNGRKKYQRRMFIRNQELYYATKYFGKVATQDQIMMRFNNPVGATISPDFTLYITPYSDMYIGTSFGNVTPTNFRAKAGIEYTIPCSIESGTADITLIYGASFIQAIGDLSKCYVGDNDFSKASRLQSLVIGSDTDGYTNSFMTKISLGNNKLLEYLDIRNITGLNSAVDLSQCGNLLELHADGSGATGVIFANGGKVQKVYIPAITSLTMKNLNYLEEFVIESYDKLQTLIVEYTPFLDTYEMVDSSSALKVLRLLGIDWTIENDDILVRALALRGINNTGGEIPQSVLAGKVYIPVIKEKMLEQYNAAWPDLAISYKTLVNQYVATFQNYDGTVLNVQYVTKGETPVDPVTAGLIETPTQESTVSTDYAYAGWDQELTSMFGNMIFTAVYTETVRKYTIQYASEGIPLGDAIEAEYGTYVYYEGETPTYTALETNYVYNLFKGWDDDGYVDGDKTINAVYDTMEYVDGYYHGKDLSEMSMVEVYALTTALTKGSSPKVDLSTIVESGDHMTYTMGVDFDYEGVEAHVLVDDTMEFDGTNYYDTELTLFDEDKDFILAVDYEFGSGNSSNSTLIQCYQNDGNDGFEVIYNSNPTIVWGNKQSTVCASGTDREMLVLRHVKGETGLHVYMSNLSALQSGYVELSRDQITTLTDATLIFGSKKTLDSGYYYYENKAIGKVHWAKVWFTDLGDSACKDLVVYIHEKNDVQLAHTRDKNLSDVASTRNTMSFIGSHVIYGKKQMFASDINTGGFAESTLLDWLEARYFPGMPNQLRQLVKRVKVPCSLGDSSTEVATCDCYVYVPAFIELSTDTTTTTVPYVNEDNNTFIDTVAERIRYDSDGTATEYWTRSTNMSRYFYRITSTGALNQHGQSNVSSGVVIEFSI